MQQVCMFWRQQGKQFPGQRASTTQDMASQTESCADDDINPESFETYQLALSMLRKGLNRKRQMSNHHTESYEPYSEHSFKKNVALYNWVDLGSTIPYIP